MSSTITYGKNIERNEFVLSFRTLDPYEHLLPTLPYVESQFQSKLV
jgi:hypothetical protein